jgi:Activator of Hsp90 ATPase homolog 1-like protein
VPHSRVVLTCGFEERDETVPPGASTVEVTLTPDGNGTILRLVHRDLPEPSRSQHDKTRTKPSAGLEPATPSLPWKCSTN